MARLACCLVLIFLCLSNVFEPTLAKKGNKSPKATSTKYTAPVATPFTSFDPTQQDFVKNLCQDTRKPKLCSKLVGGDLSSELEVNPITTAKVSIDIALSVASRVGAYMSNQLDKNHVKPLSTGSVQACKLNYESIVSALNLAYFNFENNHKMAIKNLNEANNMVGLCATSLKLGGSQIDTFPIEETNNMIRGLVEMAQHGSKSPTF